jgi:hypothetical protein
MTTKMIVFRPYSTPTDPRPHYELTVEVGPETPSGLPSIVAESKNGTIYGRASGVERAWRSLVEMTHDLRIEITSWGSELGD